MTWLVGNIAHTANSALAKQLLEQTQIINCFYQLVTNHEATKLNRHLVEQMFWILTPLTEVCYIPVQLFDEIDLITCVGVKLHLEPSVVKCLLNLIKYHSSLIKECR